MTGLITADSVPAVHSNAIESGLSSLPILRSTVDNVSQECHSRLDLTANELQEKSETVDVFFNAIATERLRRMPADGSRLDSTLRRASRLAFAVSSLCDSVKNFMDGAEEASQMIWGGILLLVEMGIDNIDMIDKIFCRYGRVTLDVSYLLQHQSDFQSSRALQREVAEIYAHLLQLVVHITSEYRQVTRSQNWHSMNGIVNHAFFCYFNRFILHWRRMREASWMEVKSSDSKTQRADLESVYQFLDLQDRPLQMLLESQAHSLASGSFFSWFDSHLTTFTVGPRSLMLVRGNPGAGKSALAQWTIERLQVSAEYDDWNVIPIVIRSDVPITTLKLSVLKGILMQMLDCCVTSHKIQNDMVAAISDAIVEAEAGATDLEIESHLWGVIRSVAQSNLHFMIVVDGMDQIQDAVDIGTVLELLQSTVVDTPSKLIIFTRPVTEDQIPIRETKTVHQVAMNAATTENDLTASIRDMISHDPAFSGLSTAQRQPLIAAIAERSQGCFIWAQLAIEELRVQHTYNDMNSAISEIPTNLGGLIDMHLRNTNLQRPGTNSLLAWLTITERPLRPQEVQALLSVDMKTLRVAPWTGKMERDVFEPLRRLVTLQDGFVAIRHPLIREHIRARAQTKKEVNFTLADANHDIMIRSLAWVRRNLTDEIPVSWNKMSVLARDRYLDAYVLLEYASRYWLSHMLSSKIATNEGFSFSQAFRRVLPDSVLFAQLEFTNQESQFSRSSIVRLYNMTVNVRRDVLGTNSQAVLQSLIISARAADRAHAPWANDQLYEAWTRSRTRLGSNEAITHDLEQLLVATSEGSGTAEGASGAKLDALRDMALEGWESSDISYAQRLKYLDRLVKDCIRENQRSLAYDHSKAFYRQTVKTYGPYSSETMASAEYLTHNFKIAPPDDLALEIARTKYETMVRSMDASDPRRVEFSLSLAQLYEENAQVDRADEILSKVWQGFASTDKEKRVSWDQKTKVAFYYTRFLQRGNHHDRAASLLHQLAGDLDAEGGVKDAELAGRAKQIRREARHMQLYDMDRALGMQLWKYHKATDQYTTDAVHLARSLTESAIPSEGRAADAMGNLSLEEAQMLPEWLDSMAFATTDEEKLRVSLLKMGRKLCRQHMRNEQWREGSEVICAILKHTWPGYDDPASKARFSLEEAPIMADLAQDHAYCLFRRFNVPMASIMYGNAFKAAITADQVAVQSVNAVIKTVVDFYESTFQFDKALILLRQVGEFFGTRLGDNDKHTLDSRYYEGDLAVRLDRREEAESSYQHIYLACVRDDRVSSTGLRAAVALVELYEQDKNWDSALEVYRHLWPTLVHFDEKDGYDHALLEGLLPKTYNGYMDLLMNSAVKTGYAERLQVAGDHQQLCRKIYGATDGRTRDAILLLADLSSESDRHSSEAIHLYQQVLNTHDWVPQGEASRSLPEMKEPVPIEIKHRMAQLYLRQGCATPEARKLYMEELVLAKQQQGLSAPTTLLWLREIARMYAESSRQQGSRILTEHVEEVIRVTGNQQTLADRGRKLAEIYLDAVYIDEGNTMISDIREQVIQETPASHRHALSEHRPAVFIAAFEAAFSKQQSAREILDDLTREGHVYNNFQQSLASTDLMPTLAAGDKLWRLQIQQKNTTGARNTEDQLYQYFCNILSVARPTRPKEIVHVFYSMCRRESLNENYTFDIISETTNLVREMCNSGRFEDAAIVTGVFHSWAHLTDSLRSPETIFTAIKICMYLSGYQTNKSPDEGIATKMAVESEMLLQGIMKDAKEMPIEFSELPFQELNDLITILGEHEMFEDLESILTDLWTSRLIQKTWSLSAVVWIGRRLVETRFCRGHTNAATQLGKDICYNLRQVWGNCDPVTLEMNKLLSGLYTASGNYLASAALHETALSEFINSEEHAQHGAVEAVTCHLELLQHAQARLEKEGQSAAIDAATAQERVQEIAKKFHLPIERLASQTVDGDGDVGMWQRPRRFSLDVEEAEEHENRLRQASGSAMLSGVGGGRRVSVPAL